LAKCPAIPGPTLISILGNLLHITVLLYLWNAIYRSEQSLGDYSLSDLITYYILQLLINGMVLSYISWQIGSEIREGSFSNFLVRPLNYLHYWFAINLSGKLFEGLMIAVVGLIMIGVLMDYVAVPSNWSTIPHFIFAMILAGILAFEFDFAIGILAFWLVQIDSFKYMLQYGMFFLAGALLPLDLFPMLFQQIAHALPFRFMVYFPIQIFLEKETQPYEGFLIAGLWIIGLYFLLQFGLKRGIAHYEAVGK
jgi:ABC-2 type transport system permease protein